MSDELIALADDLGYEGLQCTRILQKVQSCLLNDNHDKEEMTQKLLREFTKLSGVTDHVVQLARTLEEKLIVRNLKPIDDLFLRTKIYIEECAVRLGKKVKVEIKARDIKLDAAQSVEFENVLRALIAPFIEFTIESDRERQARGKKSIAYIELSSRNTDSGHKVSLICDGNGILPPYSVEMGEDIAKVGIRGFFEGKPGKWSAWQFFIPTRQGSVKLLPVRMGDNELCLPAWAITSVEDDAGKYKLELSAGLSKRKITIDTYSNPYDAYIKNIHPSLKCNGKYLGVVRHDAGTEDKLYLVLDPGYLVYNLSQGELLGVKVGESQYQVEYTEVENAV